MKTIVVITYQLHYSAGSECAVAMDYINHMQEDNKLFVLYGTSRGFHEIGHTVEMEEWCLNYHMQNVTFIPVKPSFITNDYGYSIIETIKFYNEYKHWHIEVRKKIKDIAFRHHVDLIHFLGPIGYREPGYLRDLGLPVIWGPIGGFGSVNPKLLRACFSMKGAIGFMLKNILNKFQYHFDVRVKKALRDTDVVIFATTEYLNIAEKLIGKRRHSIFLYRPENCINKLYSLNQAKFYDKRVNLVFVGRPDYGKALIIVLEAIKKMNSKLPVTLHVIGDGPLLMKCKSWSRENGIDDKVIWYGKIPREKVRLIMDESHVMLLPSIYDANTTVIWEAMSVGLPTIALDHCGFHDTIKSGKTGYLIPIKSYNFVVSRMSELLTNLCCFPQMLKDMANAVIVDREQYTWNYRRIFFESVYDLAIENYINNENSIDK